MAKADVHDGPAGWDAGFAHGTFPDAKRLFDSAAALALLIVFLPLLIAIGVAVIATSRGGVFYTQRRVGRHGRLFDFYKFRSMNANADRVLDDYLDSSPAHRSQWDEFQKVTDDPRVTPVGSLIRRTSLDELPQLFNVLRGDMSMVGPRPCMPSQVKLHGDAFQQYCSVRPGITGLWQVSGRNRLSYARRVELDTHYVSRRSMKLDLLILFKTPFVLGSGR